MIGDRLNKIFCFFCSFFLLYPSIHDYLRLFHGGEAGEPCEYDGVGFVSDGGGGDEEVVEAATYGDFRYFRAELTSGCGYGLDIEHSVGTAEVSGGLGG